jgi:hypothetical protein
LWRGRVVDGVFPDWAKLTIEMPGFIALLSIYGMLISGKINLL